MPLGPTLTASPVRNGAAVNRVEAYCPALFLEAKCPNNGRNDSSDGAHGIPRSTPATSLPMLCRLLCQDRLDMSQLHLATLIVLASPLVDFVPGFGPI